MLFAEELVLVFLALRHFRGAEHDRISTALVRHLVAVQVVAVLDGPVDLDRVAGIGNCVSIGFLGAQELVVLGAGRQRNERGKSNE